MSNMPTNFTRYRSTDIYIKNESAAWKGTDSGPTAPAAADFFFAAEVPAMAQAGNYSDFSEVGNELVTGRRVLNYVEYTAFDLVFYAKPDNVAGRQPAENKILKSFFGTESGVGGGTATTAETATATGDAAMLTTQAGNNSFMYTLPALVDGLSVSASYSPQGSNDESSSAFAGTYTGVEGLSISYGVGDNNAAAGTASNADVTSMKASYAFGPVTVAYSDHEFDSATATRDQDVESMSIAYTVSDEISITYGTETFSTGEASTVDAEYSKISVAYTSGGMTITAVAAEGENISYSTAPAEDVDYWGLTAAFAF